MDTLLAGWHHFPKEAELWWYTENYEIPATERVFVQDINQIHKLVEFKERYKNYISPQFDMDVVRFSHKVYAAVDALHDYDGIGGWIDADCVPYKDIPYSMLVDMLGDSYVACFQRPGSYTETGFWLMNGDFRTERIQTRPLRPLDEDVSKAIAKMKERERVLSELAGIDCGARGSPSCQAFAEDVVLGQARETDCVFVRERIVAERVSELRTLITKQRRTEVRS